MLVDDMYVVASESMMAISTLYRLPDDDDLVDVSRPSSSGHHSPINDIDRVDLVFSNCGRCCCGVIVVIIDLSLFSKFDIDKCVVFCNSIDKLTPLFIDEQSLTS